MRMETSHLIAVKNIKRIKKNLKNQRSNDDYEYGGN